LRMRTHSTVQRGAQGRRTGGEAASVDGLFRFKPKVRMSVFGTFQTWRAFRDVGSSGKADLVRTSRSGSENRERLVEPDGPSWLVIQDVERLSHGCRESSSRKRAPLFPYIRAGRIAYHRVNRSRGSEVIQSIPSRSIMRSKFFDQSSARMIVTSW
jgi:hypothetical protein